MGSCTNQINKMQVFDERGKPEYPGKNLSEQRREPTNSTHILTTAVEIEPESHWWKGDRVLSPVRLYINFSLNLLNMESKERLLTGASVDWASGS